MASIQKTGLTFLFTLFIITNLLGKSVGIFEHLSTKDGLPHGSVSEMLKDKQGYMWFATWDGVCRYDGHTFKTFKQELPVNGAFISNRIDDLKLDSLGNIWVLSNDYKVMRFNWLTEKMDLIVDKNQPNILPTITGIHPFANGDVWLTTKNQGAYRVVTNQLTNQYTVEHYHSKSSLALPGNAVYFIAEDYLKNIWINTDKGLAYLVRNKHNSNFTLATFNVPFTKALAQQNIISYCSTKTHIYFGSEQGKFLIVNPKKLSIKKINFNNKQAVSDIALAYNGCIYLGTRGNGVFEFNEHSAEITRHFFNPTIATVLKSFADIKGNLWVESNVAGISKFNLFTGAFNHYQQKLDIPADIRSEAQCGMMEDENGTLWLTLKGGGFGYFDHQLNQVAYFYNEPNNPNSKLSNFVKCFYKDSSGTLWLSTYFKGIEKISFNQNQIEFKQPAPQQNLSIANEVRAMMEDSKQMTWVATKNKTLYILDKQFKVVKTMDEIDGKKIGLVYALLEDSYGNIYIGTKGNGLFIVKRNGLLNFTAQHYVHHPSDSASLTNNNIYSLLEDKQGRIWIGTFGGGINILNEKQLLHKQNVLTAYPAEHGEKVRHIACDAMGNVWIGTTQGLFFVNTQASQPKHWQFKHYSKDKKNIKGLLGNDIFWILCDANQGIWVASLGGGLAQLKNYPNNNEMLDFNAFTKKDGLPSDMIFTLIDDENGTLWMSTENGISQYQTNNKVFKNFSIADGIVNSTFSEAAIAVHANGQLSFGANKGFYSFNPNHFTQTQQKANLVFTKFTLFGKEVIPDENSVLKKNINQTTTITLKHNQNVIGLSWAGLNYKMQKQMQFAYKLNGFDNDWQNSNGLNQANYTKLPPGKYQFNLKYLNPELQTLNKTKALTIEILPPVYKTTWAYMLYAILLAVLFIVTRRTVITIIRLRNKVVIEKKLTEIKLNFFTNISHELRTPLTLISGPAKALLQSTKPNSNEHQYAQLIEQNAQRLIRMVNHLLDFRKIQSNKLKLHIKSADLVNLCHKVANYFNAMANEKSIRFSVTCNANSIMVLMDEEKMESVIFNLLSNAFKFTPQMGEIWLSINENISKNKVTLEVKDTGLGVHKSIEDSLFTVFANYDNSENKKNTGTGIGLALAKELVLLHKGNLSYRKDSKGGAIFSVELPLNTINLQEEAKAKNSVYHNDQIVEDDQPKTLSEPSNKPCVLVVEDNQELRKFLKLQLSSHYQVQEASNGKDGIKAAIKLQPDIILSDVMMPEMDGIEMLNKLKSNFEISHIPVILLTAKSSVESKIEGLQYGADAYITKPFSTEQLLAQIANLLNQRILLSEIIARQGSIINKKEASSITEKDAQFLNNISQIIEENLANTDFKIEWLYKNIGMGRSNFFSKVKGLTGSSPIEFVKEYRLNKANKLLQTGEYNVSEVAFLSGFADAGYFSKRFKDRFGINPSELVKK